MKVYGISNCDTVKKARKALDEAGSHYEFIDLKSVKLDNDLLDKWLTQHPDKLVNKRSTTYRQHKEAWLTCDTTAHKLTFLQNNPTIIKRPVIEHDDGRTTIGWPI